MVDKMYLRINQKRDPLRLHEQIFGPYRSDVRMDLSTEVPSSSSSSLVRYAACST